MDTTKPYANQFLPIIVTIFGGVLTVQYLYTITHQRDVLLVTFILIYGIALRFKEWINESLYPPRADGKVERRRTVMSMASQLVMDIAIVVIIRLVYDIFTTSQVMMVIQWWAYIVLGALGFTFLFAFLTNRD